MGGVKNAVEPLAIVLVFTISTLVNRTRNEGHSRWEPDRTMPDARQPLIRRPSPSLETESPKIEYWLPHPETTKFHMNYLSQFLRKFPFLVEIWYWALTYWPYQLMRAATATHINSTPERRLAVHKLAKNNALRIFCAEQWLGLDVEYQLQHFILTRCKTWVMTLLCDIYLAHITVGIAFLGYAYTYFPHARYQHIRRTMALNNFIAFAILTAYRCTPPRLMPSSFGFIDVLHPRPGTGVGEPSDWANNRFQLTLAAMPSLHFGTSLLIGLSVTMWGKHTFLRSIMPFYPFTMLLVVLATANHWVLDCFGGVFVVGIGLTFNWILLGLRPIEEWLFWVLRIEKPREWPVNFKGNDGY